MDEEESLLTRPVHFTHHPSFEVPGAEEAILGTGPCPGVGAGDTLGGASTDPLLPAGLTPPDGQPEWCLFRKMNYLLFRAENLRQRASLRGFGAGEREQLRRLLKEAKEVRDRLIQANLGLVMTRARRFLGPGREMAELRSEGHYALLRAVRTFDFSQDVRFSTYLCTALDRSLLRFVRGRKEMDGNKDMEGGDGDPLAAVVDYRAAGPRRDAWREELREQVPGLLQQLGEPERLVIERRYGLNGATEPATLKAVGSELDVSEERVRQLEEKALRRLMGPAIQRGLEPFDD